MAGTSNFVSREQAETQTYWKRGGMEWTLFSVRVLRKGQERIEVIWLVLKAKSEYNP